LGAQRGITGGAKLLAALRIVELRIFDQRPPAAIEHERKVASAVALLIVRRREGHRQRSLIF
jgi:hypothetical protein